MLKIMRINMFYEPKKKNHGLAHNPFNSLIVPRPIGWISSLGLDGVPNLAPYSFFNAVSYQPPRVMFSSGTAATEDGLKDSLRNNEDTKEFVCNMATWDWRNEMNESSKSVALAIDEIAMTGLTTIDSRLVSAPRLAEAPVNLECIYLKSVSVPGWSDADNFKIIIGEVIGVHIKDEFINQEGLVDIKALQPIGRLGGNDYAVVNAQSFFSLKRP
jgi:flavin reductase (DIM6/NTAB) family NADH-FMN oxidoreductase RutF